MPHYLANIEFIAKAAKGTPHWDEGLRWYHEVFQIAAQLHENPHVGASVLAVLSPRCPWTRNVELAWRWARGEPVATTSVIQRKLDLIRRGHRDQVRGPKVTAFMLCIIEHGCSHHVCVDTHALAIVRGRRPTPQETARLSNPTHYGDVARLYQLVARRFKIYPAQLQAITWCYWRANGRTAQYYLPFTLQKETHHVESSHASAHPAALADRAIPA